MTEPERIQSHAFAVLRSSSKRLLQYIQTECERHGGAATIHDDQFAMIGSRRVIRPGLAELVALGLIEHERRPKCSVCKISSRWRSIASRKQAARISVFVRENRPDVRPDYAETVGAR